jgi:hypothetical protein
MPNTSGEPIWFRKDPNTLKIAEVPLDRRDDGSPLLLRATFYTKTGGDNKDHNTGVWVNVKTSKNDILLADISNADTSDSDSTEYNDHSEHIIEMRVDSPGIPQSQCRAFNVHLWITTHGKDKWEIETARVLLLFSDGTAWVAEKHNFSLVNNGASTDFSQSRQLRPQEQVSEKIA